MKLKSRVMFEVVNAENGQVISREEVISVDVSRPETIDQIGLETALQQELVQLTEPPRKLAISSNL